MVLRQQPVDWRTLNRYIEQMPPAMREDPTWIYWHSRGLVALGAVQEGQAGYRSRKAQPRGIKELVFPFLRQILANIKPLWGGNGRLALLYNFGAV